MPINSNRKRLARKTTNRPAKPYPEFPLYAHPLGYWSKKIRKGIKHFGRWGKVENGKMKHLPYEANWRDALATFKARIDDAQTGRIVESVVHARPAQGDGLRLGELCNRYLNAKLRKVEAGEIKRRTFQGCKSITDMLVTRFGAERLVHSFSPEDFERLRAAIAKRCGPVRLGNEVTSVKSVFKYAIDNRLIEQAVHYGSEFSKPSKSVMRRHKAESDKKLFAASEIRAMLDVLTGRSIMIGKKSSGSSNVATVDYVQLRAAILLGINTGAGNTDVANLELKHIDLKARWLNYPRSKTGVGRRVPLWAETVAALRTAIAERPAPKHELDADIVLLTGRRKGDMRSGGTRLVVQGQKSRTDYLGRRMNELLRRLHIQGRKHLGFYSLRHTLATVGLQIGDRDAVKAIMGQVEGDVLASYDETGPSDKRLQQVVHHVHKWLFTNPTGRRKPR